MTQPQSFRSTVRSLLRDRLLDAAAATFAEKGWRKLTMSQVAAAAGVSRQTVYNEFGTKQQMAEQLVARELDQFLQVVRANFLGQRRLTDAIRTAVVGALTKAERSALLRAVLGGEHVGDQDLLPFIIQSQVIIDTATESVVSLISGGYGTDLDDAAANRLPFTVETLVRIVLSHVTQPSRPIEEVGEELSWLVESIMIGARHRGTPGPGKA